MSLRGWTLKSRVRYASAHTAGGASIYLGISAMAGTLSAESLWLLAALTPVVFLVHGWVWYPRAKRRLGGL